MSAMNRSALPTCLFAAILSVLFLAIPLRCFGQDANEHLRDAYQGKVFVLRGFPEGDALLYDSSGSPQNAASGDWTTDGFVQVSDIHLSGDRLVIKAQRMVAVWLPAKQFELRPLERAKGKNGGKELARVEIKADTGMHNPSPQQIDALVSKIFLTSQDSLADLVPDYWQPCVRGALRETDKTCAFFAEMLAVPGVRASDGDHSAETGASDELSGPRSGVFRIGKGVTPPRPKYQPDPEFSEAARVAKFQGIVALDLVVNKEGVPTHIRISKPAGYGLDAKAVAAVQAWKFVPAEKDGLPVPVQIDVEVNFHLY